MFEDPLLIIPLVAVLVVLLILLTGIGSFGRGGEFNKRNANKIMRYRIYAQAVAIVLILGYVWLRRQGG
ncbi:MAG: twin transmembrane helix small protein [Maritimibacter sp.]|jgi:preprotein translocase subunit SecG|uniref:twin transmembrane helix small protein n=1 Tax=Maritimibacter sp. TaxID=2003363 RepID=UPI001DB8FCC9|nr:twin transmembrane helix small protein [Maritimibacter sp.]MBL6428171.1 twin transmembrane helix small protein [Maritimibacter sp.]